MTSGSHSTSGSSWPPIVLGTHNLKKRLELDRLLRPHGFQLQTLEEFPAALEVSEDGQTFAENAAKKASVQARHLRVWVLGEDSGLEVPMLGDAPGVYSARYAGAEATDAENNQKLLQQLQGVPQEKRNARFVCHMALADPQGHIVLQCQAACHGRLRFAPSGQYGFGYDPLFEVPEYHRTFGELGLAVKSLLSHRARAARQLLHMLVSRQPPLPLPAGQATPACLSVPPG